VYRNGGILILRHSTWQGQVEPSRLFILSYRYTVLGSEVPVRELETRGMSRVPLWSGKTRYAEVQLIPRRCFKSSARLVDKPCCMHLSSASYQPLDTCPTPSGISALTKTRDVCM
jgi:hypothetical protein